MKNTIPRIHKLKTLCGFFREVVAGVKTFEIRKNDRDFQVDDFLQLEEYDGIYNKYTGRSVLAQVKYILDDTQYVPEGYVCMGIWLVDTIDVAVVYQASGARGRERFSAGDAGTTPTPTCG